MKTTTLLSALLLFFLLCSATLTAQQHADDKDFLFNDSLWLLVTQNPLDVSVQKIDSIQTSLEPDTANMKYAIVLRYKGYLTGYAQEDFQEAINIYNRAVEIIKQSEGYSSFMHNKIMGDILYRIGATYKTLNDIKGLDYLMKAIEYFKKNESYKKAARAYSQMAIYFSNTLGTEATLFFHELGRENMLKDSTTTLTDHAYYYRGIGIAYGDENPDSSLYYFEKAYNTIKNDTTCNPADQLNLAAGAAEIAIRHKKFEKAKPYTNDALKLTKKIYGEKSVIMAHIYFQLVQIYGHNGMMDSVQYYSDKGFELYDAKGEKYIWKINAYNHLYRIERQRGNYEKALELTHKAMWVNAPNMKEPADVDSLIPLDSTYTSYEKLGNAYYNKMRIYHDLYVNTKNIKYLEKSNKMNLACADYLLNVHYRNNLSSGDLGNAFSEAVNEVMDFMLWTMNEAKKVENQAIDVARGYDYFSELKAGLLNEQTGATGYANASEASKIKAEINTLRNEIHDLQFIRKYKKLPQDSIKSIQAQLVDDYIRTLKLKQQLKDIEVELDDVEKVNKLQVVKLSNIGENQAIVDYYYNDSCLYAFVSTQSNINIVEAKIDEEFPGKVRTTMRYLKTANPKLSTSASELYNLVIEPVAPLIEDKEHLIIIPDKQLYNIPFEILRNSQNNYLVEQYAITYNFSARYKQKPEKNKTNKIVAFAPAFQGESLQANNTRGVFFNEEEFGEFEFIDQQKHEIVNLPYAKEEVKAINEIFSGKVQLVVGKNATEEQFRSIAPTKQIVHIASHGYASVENPELSGIFFRNANDGDENDGYLFLNEVKHLNFDTDLVVLSACQSGKGKVEGIEGVIALPRTFFAAGVPNILASLWKVDDKNTMMLMKRFYKNLKKHQNYSKALQEAKKECINEGMLPLDWSGFTLLGE